MDQNGKTSLLFIIVLVFGSLSISTYNPVWSTPDFANEKKNVILMVWDGCQLEDLRIASNKGLTPNLDSLNISWSEIFLEYNTTKTKQAHATMLTGYAKEITGVIDNNIVRHNVSHELTVFYRIKERYSEIKTCFITGKTRNVGSILQDSLENVDFSLNEDMNIWKSKTQMLEFLEKTRKDKFFAFFHSRNPDRNGHQAGERSINYTLGIIENDKALGEIMIKLAYQGRLDNTVFYVLTDHGFNENKRSHNYDPYAWLVSNDPNIVDTSGEIRYMRDVVPTIYHVLDIDYSEYKPVLTGIPLQEPVPQIIQNERIVESEELIREGMFIIDKRLGN